MLFSKLLHIYFLAILHIYTRCGGLVDALAIEVVIYIVDTVRAIEADGLDAVGITFLIVEDDGDGVVASPPRWLERAWSSTARISSIR